ncbi:hypothetical protein GOV12_04255 [Candidatus Pacearchaeota archaeon]|nr:hypothetical protein [Candidatus Pacearchaeota archaeon]
MKNRLGDNVEFKNNVNRISLRTGDELYRFVFYEDNISELLRTLGRYASNVDLSFTWYDAAVLSQKVREVSKTIYGERLGQIKDPILKSRVVGEVERLINESEETDQVLDHITAFNAAIA